MKPTDPSTWTPGTTVVGRDGSVYVLNIRMSASWGIGDGGIIYDDEVSDGLYIALTPAHVARLFTQDGAG